MPQHNIASVMELFARSYTKDAGITLVPASMMATDGKVIYYPPISDDADPDLRKQTEIGVLHETGHCLYTDWDIVRVIKARHNSLFNEIANWCEDIFIERRVETQWPGIKFKMRRFYKWWVAQKGNTQFTTVGVPLHNNLMRILFYRCRENLLGISFGVQVPQHLEALYQRLLAKFAPECVAADSTATTKDIAERILAVLKAFASDPANVPPPPPQKQEKQPKQKQEKGEDKQPGQPGDEGEGEEGDEPQPGQKGEKGEGEEGEKGDEGEDSQPGQPGQGEGEKGEEGDEPGQPGQGKGEEGEDSQPGQPGQPGGGSGMTPEEEDVAAKSLDEEIKNDEAGKTDADASIADVNANAAVTGLLTKHPGLKEHIQPVPMCFGWEPVVADHLKKGQEMTGYLSNKLRTLLISERAPRWSSNLETGRLDSRKLSRVRLGRSDVFRRRIPAVYEDAAVSMVMDFTGSMASYGEVPPTGVVPPTKVSQASALMVTLAETLEKLRVPFEVSGFDTKESDNSILNNRRTMSSNIWVVKNFEEPYRRVKHRFIGMAKDYTNELPAIERAANRLAQRRETKKVLFIFTDGGTSLAKEQIQATIKDLLARLVRVGFKVVVFGIGDRTAEVYAPKGSFIFVDGQFAAKAYGELVKILV